MKLSYIALGALGAAFFGTGCGDKSAPGDAPYGQAAPPAPVAAASAVAVAPAVPAATGSDLPASPVSGAPMMGSDDPNAPLSPTPAMDQAITDALKKGDKKLIAAVYATRGMARMTDDKAGHG